MKRLTESAAGLGLVLMALACAAIGLADDVVGFSNPETWLLSGLVLGILAIAVAIDEQRLSNMPVVHPAEHWVARAVMLVALGVALIGFVLGMLDSEVRNLWSVLAVILALISVAVTIDAHRVVIARGSQLELSQQRDALAGVLCAAVAFGFGLFGLLTGLFGLPHSDAWLSAGVVVAVVSTAFMFDEQVHVVHKSRRHRKAPLGVIAASRRTADQVTTSD